MRKQRQTHDQCPTFTRQIPTHESNESNEKWELSDTGPGSGGQSLLTSSKLESRRAHLFILFISNSLEWTIAKSYWIDNRIPGCSIDHSWKLISKPFLRFIDWNRSSAVTLSSWLISDYCVAHVPWKLCYCCARCLCFKLHTQHTVFIGSVQFQKMFSTITNSWYSLLPLPQQCPIASHFRHRSVWSGI